ncbi:MAG: hypothetical protein F8N37_06170 [Telmatospirillum sp.]|nr:hypothetical protein [Telmatospirillum sp.]
MSHDLLSLFNLFCIVVLPYAIWHLGRLKSAIPCAVVQILLGIILGPSGLGFVLPELQEHLLPTPIRDQIAHLSSFSIFFFALITGLHLDLGHYRGAHSGLALIGVCSVLVPFCFGTAAALWICEVHPLAAQGGGGQARFVLCTAVALSVTALPVLGAILRELDLIRLPVGQWSLGLAAINDAVLWLLVSGALAGTGSREGASNSPLVILLFGALYLVTMFCGARPLLRRLFPDRDDETSRNGILVGVVAFALASAGATEFLGLHYLLGAFVAGAILPDHVRAAVLDRIEHVTVLLLTPFFFISVGLKVSLDFSAPGFGDIFVVTTVAAIAGKFAGTTLPARRIGMSWRDSLALGAVMQAKGMMELAVLSIFLAAGLISNAMFSVLIAMALVTTALAMPLTRMLLVKGYGKSIPEDA